MHKVSIKNTRKKCEICPEGNYYSEKNVWWGFHGGGGGGDFQRELFRGNCPWNKSLASNCPRGQLLRGKCADTLKNIS